MANPILSGIHKAASVGWIYDCLQTLAGASVVRRRLRRHLENRRGLVLDIGGGTGAVGSLLPQGCSYICLDNEIPKLTTFAGKTLGAPLLADALRIPIRSGSIDLVTCVDVTHHLQLQQLDVMLGEMARVLKVDGSLLLLDAVLKPSRLPGRLLWALDRGAYPKSSTALREAIERHFRVSEWSRIAFYHEYVLAVCQSRTDA